MPEILVQQRTVKTLPNGMRPFQEEALKALDGPERIIVVEAPVGAGKSHIVRRFAQGTDFPWLILTYPTKILMEMQVGALKRELGKVRHWPDDEEACGETTLFEYSTSALVRSLKRKGFDGNLNRGKVISEILERHWLSARNHIFVTTPDVLHLLMEGVYHAPNQIQSKLKNALVVFDEFHLYTNLENFPPLIEKLLERFAAKIFLLSATPTTNPELDGIFEKHSVRRISFSSSLGNDSDKVFNHPLRLKIVPCAYTKIPEFLQVAREILPSLPRPGAVIFDSIFRLKHIKPKLERLFPHLRFFEYDGMRHDRIEFSDTTVILGTSSIEVGVEMKIKGLVTEAAFWTAAIQRIGRVGRAEPGEVFLLTRNRDVSCRVGDRTSLTRWELEEEVLKASLKERFGNTVSGEMFRGDSFPFLVVDSRSKEPTPYTEAVFSMFQIDKSNLCRNWRKLERQEKRECLTQDFGMTREKVEDLLLHDHLIPFWGVVSGELREKYVQVKAVQFAGGVEIQVGARGIEATFTFDDFGGDEI